MSSPAKSVFTRYQKFIIAVLSFLQFTIILDFMVLAPLGPLLMSELKINTAQFGWVVSAYAFSAGISGLLSSGFADRFDRKSLMLFFYSGFILGTVLCALATTYHFLLIARIVTGIFGGVVGSITFAIVTDLFEMQTRGRVMGFLQSAFAGSQVLGLPIGLYLAPRLGWHSPFWIIVGVSAVVWILIILMMKPINAHLQLQSDRNAFQHLIHIIGQSRYLKVFGTTAFLATGGFMLMPFGTVFLTANMGIDPNDIFKIYIVTGASAMIISPLVGKLSDKIGKYKVFVGGSVLSILMVVFYTNLARTPLNTAIIINVILFTGISSRIVSSSALISAIPDARDRGGFMGINSSLQQISGGIAAFIAGQIVWTNAGGLLENYDVLGYVVAASTLLTIILMYFIDKTVTKMLASSKPV